MADKAISDLIQALQITNEDQFVLEQGGVAKRLNGETLLKFVTERCIGHGDNAARRKLGNGNL